MALDVDVNGEVTVRSVSAKSTIGSPSSDQLVVHYNPGNLIEARGLIDNAVRLHQYAKELKSGMVPKRGQDTDDPLATQLPGSAK